MKAVIGESYSVRQASESFGVPRATLGDRVSGRVIPGANSGPQRYLIAVSMYYSKRRGQFLRMHISIRTSTPLLAHCVCACYV